MVLSYLRLRGTTHLGTVIHRLIRGVSFGRDGQEIGNTTTHDGGLECRGMYGQLAGDHCAVRQDSVRRRAASEEDEARLHRTSHRTAARINDVAGLHGWKMLFR